MIDISSLSAIVLAGGRSSRMGRDKALISIRGKPLLQRVCEVALECAPVVYVISPWVERYQSVLPANCRLIQERFNAEESTTQGPLVGFAQALAYVETEWVLLLACDLPGLQGETLKVWMGELKQESGAIAFLPRTAKGWEPLCGFYKTNCLSSLQAAIQRGERSFQGWLAQETVHEITPDDPIMLLNCNTPADLESWIK